MNMSVPLHRGAQKGGEGPVLAAEPKGEALRFDDVERHLSRFALP